MYHRFVTERYTFDGEEYIRWKNGDLDEVKYTLNKNK